MLKKILKTLGKGFWFFLRAIGQGCKKVWRDYQEEKRFRQMEKARLKVIERESIARGYGIEKGRRLAEYERKREVQRERGIRQSIANVESMFLGERRKKRKRKK